MFRGEEVFEVCNIYLFGRIIKMLKKNFAVESREIISSMQVFCRDFICWSIYVSSSFSSFSFSTGQL